MPQNALGGLLRLAGCRGEIHEACFHFGPLGYQVFSALQEHSIVDGKE
jgi:hypothetical protein